MAIGGEVTPELPPLPSGVSLLAVAVLETVPEPDATSVSSVNVAVAPLASVAALQVIVPVVRNAGVVQVKPAGAVMERKSSDAGSGSVMTGFVAASGPLFVSVIV
jgi:hypothetical protein